MMGFANKLSPYLGMPWVKTAEHLLAGQDTPGSDPGHIGGEVEVDGKLPKPKLPPNATHTQLYVIHGPPNIGCSVDKEEERVLIKQAAPLIYAPRVTRLRRRLPKPLQPLLPRAARIGRHAARPPRRRPSLAHEPSRLVPGPCGSGALPVPERPVAHARYAR